MKVLFTMKKLLLSIALVAMISINTFAGKIRCICYDAEFDGVYQRSEHEPLAVPTLILVSNNNPISVPITGSFSAENIGSVVFTSNNSSIFEDPVFAYPFLCIETDSEVDSVTFQSGYYTMLLTKEYEGETYYQLANNRIILSQTRIDTYNTPGYNEDELNFFFSDKRAEGSTLTSGGGWVKAVPEPATGALALAGVALLFRRRRA